MFILHSEGKAFEFLSKIGLIPKRDLEINTDKYGARMVPWSDSSHMIGFKFLCSNRRKINVQVLLILYLMLFLRKLECYFLIFSGLDYRTGQLGRDLRPSADIGPKI